MAARGIHRIRTASIHLLAVLFCGLPSTAQAAWIQKQGEWFTSQQLVYYASDTFVDDNGEKLSQPDFKKYEWNSYAEYGWTADTTVGFNLFFDHLENDYTFFDAGSNSLLDGTRSSDGLTDSEVFLRHKIWQRTRKKREWVVSLQPLVKFPSLYNDGEAPRSGTEDFDTELRVKVGQQYRDGTINYFSTLDIGYRKRFGEFRDQWKFDGTWGFRFVGDMTFMAQVFGTARAEGTAMSTSALGVTNDYDLLKAQVSLVHDLTSRTSLQAGIFTDLAARNTGEGQGVILGLWHRF